MMKSSFIHFLIIFSFVPLYSQTDRWIEFPVPQTAGPVYSFVDFTDSLHGVLCAANGFFTLTSDGGKSWTAVQQIPSSGTVRRIKMADTGTVLLLVTPSTGNTRILKMTIAASLYDSLQIPTASGGIEAISMVNKNMIGYMIRKDTTDYFLSTKNFGISWDTLALKVRLGITPSVAAVDSMTIFFGGSSSGIRGGGSLYRSDDKGMTLSPMIAPSDLSTVTMRLYTKDLACFRLGYHYNESLRVNIVLFYNIANNRSSGIASDNDNDEGTLFNDGSTIAISSSSHLASNGHRLYTLIDKSSASDSLKFSSIAIANKNSIWFLTQEGRLFRKITGAVVLTVDDDRPADYKTIQEAVSFANDNDTIRVMSGMYVENIDLSTKSLTLIGAAPESTIIKRPAKTYYPSLSGWGKCVIKNLSLDGNGDGVGISVQSAVIENTIIQHYRTGILQNSRIIKNNIIKNNDVGISYDLGLVQGRRIIESNEIYDNDDGIFCSVHSIQYPDSAVITGNKIYNNKIGIHYNRPILITKSYGLRDSVCNFKINAARNWWGTTIADTISQYVFDQNDALGNKAVVNFSDWLEGPHNSHIESDSMGIHYNDMINNTQFNLYALVPLIDAVKNDSEGEKIESFALAQNYPNPFNPSTMISFCTPLRSFVSLKVFDVMGREVGKIVSDVLPAGEYQCQWNASELPSGMYFYRLQVGSHAETKRMLLIR